MRGCAPARVLTHANYRPGADRNRACQLQILRRSDVRWHLTGSRPQESAQIIALLAGEEVEHANLSVQVQAGVDPADAVVDHVLQRFRAPSRRACKDLCLAVLAQDQSPESTFPPP